MMDRTQQQTSDLILKRLSLGGASAHWLAQAVVSYYRPAAQAPSLTGFTTCLDAEAQAAFIQLLLTRNSPNWSDDDLAALARKCEQFTANSK